VQVAGTVLGSCLVSGTRNALLGAVALMQASQHPCCCFHSPLPVLSAHLHCLPATHLRIDEHSQSAPLHSSNHLATFTPCFLIQDHSVPEVVVEVVHPDACHFTCSVLEGPQVGASCRPAMTPC